MKKFPAIILLSLLIIHPAHATPPRASEDFNHWYIIQMQGNHAGWMHESQTTNPENATITTQQEMNLTIKRGTQNITLHMLAKLEESTDHKPIRLYTLDELGSQPKETTYTYQENTIITNSPQPDKTNDPSTTKPIPLPGECFQTPAQAKSFLIQKLKNETDQFDRSEEHTSELQSH